MVPPPSSGAEPAYRLEEAPLRANDGNYPRIPFQILRGGRDTTGKCIDFEEYYEVNTTARNFQVKMKSSNDFVNNLETITHTNPDKSMVTVPRYASEVGNLLSWAHQNNIRIMAFAGGTSSGLFTLNNVDKGNGVQGLKTTT